MKNRWLAGVTLFALGFGCSQMLKMTAANATAAAAGGLIDEGLDLIEHPTKFELVNTGTARYLIIVGTRTPAIDPQIQWVEGSFVIPKDGLTEARISKIQDLGIITNHNPPYRDCRPSFEDCVEPWEPLPRPRPPQPVVLDYRHKQ